MTKLKSIENFISAKISFFEDRLGFNNATTLEEQGRDFFKASRYFAYMELKNVLSVIEEVKQCQQEAV